MKKLFVHVNENNKIAQGLYKKTGFEVGIQPNLSSLQLHAAFIYLLHKY